MTTNTKEGPFHAKTDEFMTKVLGELHVPGMSVAVVNGENTWSKGYGIADADSQAAVTPETLFPVGSITKSFTAAAAALLVGDDAKFAEVLWKTPMSELIPGEFVLQDEYATKHATLEDCLCHRTGMATHHAELGGHSLQQNVENLRHLDMTEELRAKWQYSNHMYWAVSYMIEKKTGQRLGDFLRERLWQPLGMNATFLGGKEARAHQAVESANTLHFAAQHMWDDTDASFKTLPVWDDEGLSGAGAAVSSVADCAKWLSAFLERAAPISEEVYGALTSAHSISKSESRFIGPVCYGLGWYIAVYRGEKVLYHPGGLIGSVASLILLPARKFGVVGLCNITSEGALDAALWYLIDEHLGVPEADRRDDIADTIQGLQGMKYFAENSKDIMFPAESIPVPIKPPPVPLAELLGSYKHPAYGTITLKEYKGDHELVGSFPGRIPLEPLGLAHVDGDVFLAKADLVKLIPVRAKARFVLLDEQAGQQRRLGVDFADGLTTWFDAV
ncbi:unnamed protein product [Discula destructiva]